MGKQAHDLGRQKRRYRAQPQQQVADGTSLARDLVRRGLATPNIMDAQGGADHQRRPHNTNRGK
ncbi:hypothetical protein [Pseudarthrobacter sp. SSS035]|uniref:hypothetical protein n=1 Tax=Pseudarthrobacter sp. SSS035 TaxID=2931399 RepID=UPI00200DB498|nr:hypothetical protein [Pseudarthrobacter sp. SSS035]